MALVCAQCSRVNPAEAAYCYHDGAALAGRAGGPINPGAAPFPTPFVFPSGQACRNFDQLAMTCQQNWTSALDLLKQGFLASFFGGLGRVDLALAAQEAAKFPDPDRGLDQLLAKLPSQVVEAPKLQVEPRDISLGQIAVGADRLLELHLSNRGMRLLYGSVSSDSKWLTLGEAPGQPQKLFQFGDEAVIPVQVRGQHLRAGARPLAGQLVVESNGGTVTVTVRADVPVTPFAGGLFDGAVTPRKVAEKAKATPKEAAPYFEDGRVAAWFQSNGWTYPVQGPPMSGMGAVQQFFEALGVAKPPQIEISPTTIRLDGVPGKTHQLSLEVSSPERKVVYGWATADQTWVAVGKTKLSGRSATIPVTVTVPDRAGTQEAKLTVVGNGQQRFTIPVSVSVIGGAEVLDDAEILDGAEILDDEATIESPVLREAALIAETSPFAFSSGPAPVADAPPARPARPARPPSVPSMTLDSPVMRAAPPPIRPAEVPFAASPPLVGAPGDATLTFSDGPPASAAMPEASLAVGAPGAVVNRPAALLAPARPAARGWLHLVPLAALGVALFITLAHDIVHFFFYRVPTTTTDVVSRPLLGLEFDYNFNPKKVDRTLGSSMMAGLVRIDPDRKNNEPKKLTFGRHGHTNSVVVRINGKDRVFGNIQNGRYVMTPKDATKGRGKVCAFEFLPERIVVTQTVRLVPGEPVEVSPDVYKRLFDTCLFDYQIKNDGNQAYDVGMRYLLDTYIGSNDGVPFTLPGQPDLIDTYKELKGDLVPDFIQVLEQPDLKNPGLIAQLNLRLGKDLEGHGREPPGRVELTAYPSNRAKEGLTKDHWDIPLASIKDTIDSCVVLYWDPAQLGPGQFRDMAFTYGLGNVSIGPSAKLGLTVGGAPLVGGELTVVALVADPQPGQTVELVLPPGLERAQSTPAVQTVTPSEEKNKEGRPRPSPVSWRVRPSAEGSFTIAVETRIGGEVVTQQRRVNITRVNPF